MCESLTGRVKHSALEQRGEGTGDTGKLSGEISEMRRSKKSQFVTYRYYKESVFKE